jgi:hypothetical protein
MIANVWSRGYLVIEHKFVKNIDFKALCLFKIQEKVIFNTFSNNLQKSNQFTKENKGEEAFLANKYFTACFFPSELSVLSLKGNLPVFLQ